MTAHDDAVKAATARWYRAQSPSPERCMDGAIRAYLAHIAAAGWKLTPREATEDMHAAMGRLNHPRDHELWRAAHDAAPSPETLP